MSEKFNISEISRRLVGRNGLKQASAQQLATAVFALIQEGLEADGQVKVRGLGTFKIVGVSSRESVNVNTGERVLIEGHEKLSFTPDATMKEIVNKPFSQFETVVLNEGVEFDDMANETVAEPDAEPVAVLPEEEQIAAPEEEQPTAEEVEQIAPVDELPAEIVPDETIDDSTPVDKLPTSVEESSDLDAESVGNDEVLDEEEEENGSNFMKWLLYVILVLASIAAAAYAGYRYGYMKGYQSAALPKVVAVPVDTIPATVESTDSLTTKKPMEADNVQEPADILVHPSEVKHESEAPKPAVVTKPRPASAEKTNYESKDERVRTGAYRIVGHDYEYVVRPGQGMLAVSRATLGEGMECYIEVFNDIPSGSPLKAGQRIKIPKLQLKKRKR